MFHSNHRILSLDSLHSFFAIRIFIRLILFLYPFRMPSEADSLESHENH